MEPRNGSGRVKTQPAPEARQRVARASGFARSPWIKFDKHNRARERAHQGSPNMVLVVFQSQMHLWIILEAEVAASRSP